MKLSDDGVGPRRQDQAFPAFLAGEDVYRFLRSGHILSAILREILREISRRELHPHSLTWSQLCFLKLIALNSDLQMGEVARGIGVTPAACSKNVDKLVRLGLVFRAAAPRDRRATLLSASPEGVDLVCTYEGLKATVVAPIIDELGSEKIDTLCALLDEVSVGLLELGEFGQGPCMRCAGYSDPACSIRQAAGECALQMGHESEPEATESEAPKWD